MQNSGNKLDNLRLPSENVLMGRLLELFVQQECHYFSNRLIIKSDDQTEQNDNKQECFLLDFIYKNYVQQFPLIKCMGETYIKTLDKLLIKFSAVTGIQFLQAVNRDLSLMIRYNVSWIARIKKEVLYDTIPDKNLIMWCRNLHETNPIHSKLIILFKTRFIQSISPYLPNCEIK